MERRRIYINGTEHTFIDTGKAEDSDGPTCTVIHTATQTVVCQLWIDAHQAQMRTEASDNGCFRADVWDEGIA